MDTTFEKLDIIPKESTKDIVDNMEKYAQSYTDCHELSESDQNVELVLTDLVNYVGRDLKYRMHNSELKPLVKRKQALKEIRIIKPNTLLNILLTYYKSYYDDGIIASIESHSDFYDIGNDFLDEDNSLDILVGYLNFIAKSNGINHTFNVVDITGKKFKKKCLTISPRLKNN